jgi:phage repressor protein C with HTH and peptisase S24 domain
MTAAATILLSVQQQFCKGFGPKTFVVSCPVEDIDDIRRWVRTERERRGWSTTQLATRARGIAREQGDPIGLNQQLISNLEQPDGAKRIPSWLRYVRAAFERADEETAEDPHLTMESGDESVMVEMLPTYVGAGGPGTGEGDRKYRAVSAALVSELKVLPADLLMIEIMGDSMAPEYLSGDQMLANRILRSTAQPGAFCLWDGDGYVVKYIERIPGSEPAKVRVMSGNSRYTPHERLVEEIDIVGRIVWFGRRV